MVWTYTNTLKKVGFKTHHFGNNKQRRSFKEVKALPVDYTANKNAWMTQKIFSGWIDQVG